jgi:hypothetical protein
MRNLYGRPVHEDAEADLPVDRFEDCCRFAGSKLLILFTFTRGEALLFDRIGYWETVDVETHFVGITQFYCDADVKQIAFHVLQ